MVLCLAEAVCLIVLPWVVGWVEMLINPGRVYLNGLPMPAGWLAAVDLIGIFAVYACYSLYKRISARISDGVPGYAFLDRVRLSLTLLSQTIIFLVIFLAVGFH
ncbi:MAG TPA: hypothetical protein VHU89_01235 [Acidobacteriaceae bacterium]|jgi:hypothetical protein|nr:hypothetical protein [Acidobacteriaceae bacterium]